MELSAFMRATSFAWVAQACHPQATAADREPDTEATGVDKPRKSTVEVVQLHSTRAGLTPGRIPSELPRIMYLVLSHDCLVLSLRHHCNAPWSLHRTDLATECSLPIT